MTQTPAEPCGQGMWHPYVAALGVWQWHLVTCWCRYSTAFTVLGQVTWTLHNKKPSQVVLAFTDFYWVWVRSMSPPCCTLFPLWPSPISGALHKSEYKNKRGRHSCPQKGLVNAMTLLLCQPESLWIMQVFQECKYFIKTCHLYKKRRLFIWGNGIRISNSILITILLYTLLYQPTLGEKRKN